MQNTILWGPFCPNLDENEFPQESGSVTLTDLESPAGYSAIS